MSKRDISAVMLDDKLLLRVESCDGVASTSLTKEELLEVADSILSNYGYTVMRQDLLDSLLSKLL